MTPPITRRQLLQSAAVSALAQSPLTHAQTEASRRLKAVVCGGHPGDPEYGCGGLISRWTTAGHEAVVLYLNDGAWPPTPASTRLAEAAKACEILKARPLYASQANGHAVVDNAHYEAFGQLIAAEKPDLVLTQWPIDNHRDHRATAMLAFDAWQASKHSFALYYYEVSNGEDTLQFSPTHYIDITAHEPAKRAACYAHASQTPDRYYKLQDDVAAFRGVESGYSRAEAFLLQQRSPADPLRALMSH